MATEQTLRFGALALCIAVASLRCADSDESGALRGLDIDPNIGGSGTGGGSAGGAQPPLADAAVPEREIEASFRAPVATGRFVWTANPESSRVALIDALTYEVRTIEAGFGATHLAALPSATGQEDDAALVLNVKSHDATLLRVLANGSVQTKTLPTHEGANAWAVSPGGRWAVAWTDARQVEKPDPTDGFQDVTVISLESGAESAVRLSVGYRPVAIRFDAAETHAFAVSEPGISVIELAGGAHVTKLLEVTDDPADTPASRDVSITPDGSYALIRVDGSADVGVVSLASGERKKTTLRGVVTDLDLSADGKRAFAVLRDLAEIAILPIPEIFTSPAGITTQLVKDELFGSVSLAANSAVALLYTNAVPSDHLTILDTAPGPTYLSYRTVALKAPISGVFPAPDAEHAIAFLEPALGGAKRGAFSVVSTLAARAPKIIATDAPAQAVAITSAPSDRALVTIRDDPRRKFGVYLIRLPALQVDFIPLASAPLATGIVAAARRAYVAQLHPEGRITFVNLEDGSARTLTGFELGIKVVQ